MNPLAIIFGMPAALRWGLMVAAVAAAAWVGHLIDLHRAEARAEARGRAAVQQKWDAAEKIRAETAAKAEAAARAEEQRRTAAQLEQNRVDENHASQRRADLAAVAARADGVQRQLADIAAHRDPAPGDTAPAEQCQATREAAGMLAALLERAERRARVVESYADESADAAESCAGRFDSLRGGGGASASEVSR
jgi:hypothetical protein